MTAQIQHFDAHPDVYGRDHALTWLVAGSQALPETIGELVWIRAALFDGHSPAFAAEARRAATAEAKGHVPLRQVGR